jgi:hypothetical protein
MPKSFATLLLLIFSCLSLYPQSQEDLLYDDNIFDSKIKTAQLYKDGWNLSYPVIKINSEEKLILHFDLLGNEIETYYYTFIHCTKDWANSDIFPNDYLDGFPENQIEDYKSSFNTTVNYTHYSLAFPNERIRFKSSGNCGCWNDCVRDLTGFRPAHKHRPFHAASPPPSGCRRPARAGRWRGRRTADQARVCAERLEGDRGVPPSDGRRPEVDG